MVTNDITKFKRVIAIGDIHGSFYLLRRMVEEIIKFNPKTDLLIFLGDYIDRGFSSAKVIRYLSDLRSQYPDNIILLKGNHELMAENALDKEDFEQHRLWFANGGRDTMISFRDENMSKEEFIAFSKSLRTYFQTEEHIFVHGGVPEFGLTYAITHELLWHRDNEQWRGDKMLVVGHTIHNRVSQFPNNVVCVDTGAVSNGLLSAYDVVNDRVYEVFTAYKEKGQEKIDKPIKRIYIPEVKEKYLTDFEVVTEKAKDIIERATGVIKQDDELTKEYKRICASS